MTIADDAAVDLLANMLRVPSLCGAEDEVADLLCAAIQDAGFPAHRDEVGNVIGSFGNSHARARSAVILGHMDTVPGHVPVEQRDGALYGRGAVDAKGPLAVGVAAAVRASATGRADLHITVIGAVQEEGPSVGARHLARTLPAPDFLVIAEPGGWDSIVLGYKGSLRFTVTLSQPAAHTAGRDPSAPERAVAFWNRLVHWCETQTPLAEPGQRGVFNHLTATLIGMESGSDGLEAHASLHVGLRLPPGISVQAAQSGVEALAGADGCLDRAWGGDCRLDFSPGEPAVRADKGTPLVAAFMRAIRAEDGKPRFKVKTGTADMNVVGPVWGCPMLAYGPGDSNLDHTPNEHIKVDEYTRAIRVLTHVLEEL